MCAEYESPYYTFAMLIRQQELIDRIKKLPHDGVAEVAEFVESLTDRRA
jgi:hypothetical protein